MSTEPSIQQSIPAQAPETGIPVLAPVEQNLQPAPAPSPSAYPEDQARQTLEDVIAARRAEREGTATPQQPEALATPPVETTIPQPQDNNQALIDAQKEQLFKMATENPQQLVEWINAQQKQQAPEAQAETNPQFQYKPEDYRQTAMQTAAQMMQERPTITTEDIFGSDVFAELQMENNDFTPVLEQFVHATIAPVIANLLSDLYGTQYGFNQQSSVLQPLIGQRQHQELSQNLATQIHAAAPIFQGNEAAQKYAAERWETLAPQFMSKNLLDNPSANPDEYARIAVGIAKLAADEFAKLLPAQGQSQPNNNPSASLTPAPQPVVPHMRNHLLGNFAQTEPQTLMDMNRQGARAIIEQLEAQRA